MKRVVDLSFEELSELATTAFAEAAKKTLKAGLPITGSIDGRLCKVYPDGRTEFLDGDNMTQFF